MRDSRREGRREREGDGESEMLVLFLFSVGGFQSVFPAIGVDVDRADRGGDRRGQSKHFRMVKRQQDASRATERSKQLLLLETAYVALI